MTVYYQVTIQIYQILIWLNFIIIDQSAKLQRGPYDLSIQINIYIYKYSMCVYIPITSQVFPTIVGLNPLFLLVHDPLHYPRVKSQIAVEWLLSR